MRTDTYKQTPGCGGSTNPVSCYICTNIVIGVEGIYFWVSQIELQGQKDSLLMYDFFINRFIFILIIWKGVANISLMVCLKISQ